MEWNIRYNEPLARHTSWRVGGPAERFFIPSGTDDLLCFVRESYTKRPVFWLGLGTNLLVRDGGIRGTVILTAGALNAMEQLDAVRWRVEAGVSSAKVARQTMHAGLQGAEFLAGIPGTFGGALAMNAGAFGGETWPLVSSVETLDSQGRLRRRPAEDYTPAYRCVTGPPDEKFIAAIIRLQPGLPDSGRDGGERIRRLLARRRQTQPVGSASCGSVFRNPPGEVRDGMLKPRYAACLIEEAGLKGTREGGAMVSEKHANFIINTGKATAEDIETLMTKIVKTVESVHGVRLVPEVRVVGEYLSGKK
ncbi:MAG: UDP-N-acetylmuramate dehydrogenase [Gammaproteobacteria bacterium]|nr:UDP-N-acetylmuramate dehydrogenase [Gammaproteobacteria bacterium]